MPRRAALILLVFCAATVAAQHPSDAVWRGALERATREKKPLLVFFRPTVCAPCDDFERLSLTHPTIERRLPTVVFVSLPCDAGEAAHLWSGDSPGVALFDRTGVVRARWRVLPDTMRLGLMIDSAAAVSSHLERAASLIETGAEAEADLVIADALETIGRPDEAQAIRRARGREEVGAPRAQYVRPVVDTGVIRILPFARQVVSGYSIVRTNIGSSSVSRVVFSLDGRRVTETDRPPFTARMNFGPTPERHTIRAVAFDRRGREAGRAERVVNDGGETFWVQLTEPPEGPAAGSVRVALSTRVPVTQKITRVVVSWNDAERAVLRSAPWQTVVTIPAGEVGVLACVAELDDGRTSEDAVLLNAGGFSDREDVVLVELPITILRKDRVRAADITVREGSKTRLVRSLSTADETPLTIGLLLDTSESMQKTLPDVQEAAMRFVKTVLRERDRAFLVRFDTRASLVQAPTGDRERLGRLIMALHPRGLTALYDATALGLLQFQGVKGRRALILFTDGLDRTSEYSAADVGELAKRTNVPIHVIASILGVPAGTAPATAEAEFVDPALRRAAEATGGTFHILRDLADLPGVYERIDAALRAQVLAFIRSERATWDNEWRRVRIEVRGAGAEVYAPAGYYAPR